MKRRAFIIEVIISAAERACKQRTAEIYSTEYFISTLAHEMLKTAHENYLAEIKRRGYDNGMSIEEFALTDRVAYIFKLGELVKVVYKGEHRYGVVSGYCNCESLVTIRFTNGDELDYDPQDVTQCDIPQDIIDLVKKGGVK